MVEYLRITVVSYENSMNFECFSNNLEGDAPGSPRVHHLYLLYNLAVKGGDWQRNLGDVKAAYHKNRRHNYNCASIRSAIAYHNYHNHQHNYHNKHHNYHNYHHNYHNYRNYSCAPQLPLY